KELLERFYQAASNGDVDGLIALLATDAVVHSDGGGKATALPHPIHGADNIARAAVQGLRRLTAQRAQLRMVSINGVSGFVSYLNGRPHSVFSVETRNGRIQAIYMGANP